VNDKLVWRPGARGGERWRKEKRHVEADYCHPDGCASPRHLRIGRQKQPAPGLL